MKFRFNTAEKKIIKEKKKYGYEPLLKHSLVDDIHRRHQTILHINTETIK